MKGGLKYIVGKQIAGVVVAEGTRSPRSQVFLVFADGSSFEFYGDTFTCCAGLDKACDIERYIASSTGLDVHAYGEAPEPWRSDSIPSTGRQSAPYNVAAAETLESLMTRDLAAWREARALIDRAKRS